MLSPKAQDIAYSVEMVDAELRLCVVIRGSTIPVPISGAQAGRLAQSLLAASVLSSERTHPTTHGSRIGKIDLPVTAWQTGVIPNERIPLLVLDVRGGTRISFQFTSEMASRCGRSLNETGNLF